MRYLVLLLLVMSCMAPPSRVPPESVFMAIDFTPYTSHGFLFTPEKYTAPYESIGMVQYILVPGANLVTIRKSTRPDGTVVEEKKEWRVEKLTLKQGLDSLYTMASRMGADAIMNFTWTVEERTYPFTPNPLSISGYNLSGYAIKRR